MIMNMKGKLALGFMSVCVGAFALSLTSCKNSREMPVNEEQMHEVVTESYLLQEDGTLISFGSESLKATENEKGKITGAGKYYHKQQATITAEAKGSYSLYSLYEKTDKLDAYTKAKGTEGIVGGKTKTINLEVTQNLTFVAIFMGKDGADRKYDNLKINGTNGNYTAPAAGAQGAKGNLTAIGEEYQAVKTYDGTIIRWDIINGTYKDWIVKDNKAAWLTLSPISDGNVAYALKDHISKTEGARTATFQIGKDGVGSGTGVWRTITITQNSYWDGSTQDPTNPTKFVDAQGSKINLPTTTALAFNPNGQAIDLKTKEPLYGKTIYAVYQVYENGKLAPENKWIKKEVKPSFGATPDWVRNQGTQYTAGKNDTPSNRKGSCTVTWNVDGKKVGASTITFAQNRIEYNVDGEVL